jgi:hypothetical protein
VLKGVQLNRKGAKIQLQVLQKRSKVPQGTSKKELNFIVNFCLVQVLSTFKNFKKKNPIKNNDCGKTMKKHHTFMIIAGFSRRIH